jgi:hypothetical protein
MEAKPVLTGAITCAMSKYAPWMSLRFRSLLYEEEPVMKIPFENHFDTFGKVIGALLKCGIFVGSTCVVAYSLRIGRFPQGLTLGDSLLLLMAAICFGAVASIFIYSLVGLGITLSPLVRMTFWVASKLVPKFAKSIKDAPYTLAPLSWFAAFGALFAILIIFALAQRDVSSAWNLPLLSIALYFIYSVYASAGNQLVKLLAIVDSPVESTLKADYGTRDKISKLKTARWAAPLCIVAVSLFAGGATGEVLDASMRAAKIRIESPIIYVKQPYSSLMPKALVNAGLQAPTGYITYEGVSILFHGFGTVTVLAFEDGHRHRTLDIPNEYIIIERSPN